MSPATGRRQLAELASITGERDWRILADLDAFRLLDAGQIRRLHFADHASLSSAVRSTQHHLRRLAANGLIRALDRRVGGAKRGAEITIWHLTAAGQRLNSLHHGHANRAVIRAEPSPRMINHTLAVAEAAVMLHEQASAGQIELLSLESEPDCWRSYLNSAGARNLLKPDLFTVTAATSSAYEQLWFIEIDLATESAATIAAKAAVYRTYQDSGHAATRHGVMPRVAWITPNPERAQTIQNAVANTDPTARIHHAMTVAEFITTVTETGQPLNDAATRPP